MNKQKTERLVLFIIVTVLAVALSSCRKEPDTIRLHCPTSSVGYTGAIPQLFLSTEILSGKLPDNYIIEPVNINSSVDVRDALVSGKIDIGIVSGSVAISALENEMPIVILGNSVFQSAKVYSGNPNIRSVEDITKSDKLATISIGNIYHLAFMIACKEKYGDAGLYNDNLIVMDYADMFASFSAQSSELSGAIMNFPNTIRADKNESLFPILDLTPIIKEYEIGMYIVTSKDFYNDNAELIETFYKAFVEAIDFMNENPGEAALILSEFYDGIDASDVEAQIKSAPPKLEISESAYDKVAGLMYEVGMIPNPPKKFANLPNYDRIPKKD